MPQISSHGNEVLKATYALDFKDLGLSNAIRLDKQMRDGLKDSARTMTAVGNTAATQATRQQAAARAQSIAARQQKEAWKEAAAAGRSAANTVVASQRRQAVAVSDTVRKTVEELRRARVSYEDIVHVMHRYKVSADEVGAAVVRQANEEVEATKRVINIRNKLRSTVGLAPTQTGHRGGMTTAQHEARGLERGVVAGASQRLRRGAGYVGSGFLGGLIGFGSVEGMKSAIDATSRLALDTEFLAKTTGMSTKEGAAWLAIARAREVSSKQLGTAFRTLSLGTLQFAHASARGAAQSEKATSKAYDTLSKKAYAAMNHSKSAIQDFVRAGISAGDVSKHYNNIPKLYQMVTAHLDKMRTGVDKTVVTQHLLGSATAKSAASSQQAATAFRDLGITQKDVREHSKNMGDMLGFVSDRLNKMPGGLKKTRDEAALFGRGFQGMASIVDLGSKGMEEARKEAEAYGISLGDKPYESAQKLKDAQEKLRLASLGLQVQFAEHLAPAMISLVTHAIALSQTVSHFLRPVFSAIAHTAKDVVHWFKENKLALDALLVTAGTAAGLFTLAKTLQFVGRVSRGIQKDWATLKTSASIVWDLVTGQSVKFSEALNRQDNQERIAQAQTEKLTEILDKLAATYGTVAEAANGAAAAEARAAEAGGAPGMGGAARTAVGAEAGAAAQIASSERGLVGGAREAQMVSDAAARQIPMVGMQGFLYGRQGSQQITSSVARASAQVTRQPSGLVLPAGVRGQPTAVVTPAAEGVVAAETASTGLLSKVRGFGGRLMGGAGVAGMGLLAAQLAGPLLTPIVGKGIAGTLQSAGTGAAIGAGVGSVVPVLGTGVGAGIGAGVGALASLLGGSPTESQDKRVASIQRQMQAAIKSGNVSQLQKLQREAGKTATSYQSMSDKLVQAGRFGERMPDLTKQIKNLHDLANGAGRAGNALQTVRVNNFIAGLSRVKMPNIGGMLQTFSDEFGKVAPSLRQKGAAAMLNLTEGLQQQGKLPKGAVSRMIKDLERQFPGLGDYLKQQGLATDAQVADSLKLQRSRQAMRQTVANLQTQFGGMPAAAQSAGASMETQFEGSMTVLKNTIRNGTKGQRAIAEAEYGQLRDNASSYFQTMANNVGARTLDMKNAIKNNTGDARQTAIDNFARYQASIQSAMKNGLISVQEGNKDLRKALNDTLKAFGQKPIPAPAPLPRAAFPHAGASPRGHLAVGGWVPGDPHRDGTLALLAGNEFVLTGDGQQMLESAVPGLLHQIEQMQMPHFAGGGAVADQIPRPRVHGQGTITREAQGALNKATDAANRRLAKIEAQMTASSGGGGFAGNLGPANANYGQRSFATQLLRALGDTPSPNAVSNLMAWERAEGGNWNNTAKYNPLNTTMSAPGATSMNSVGVKAYTSWAEGLGATVSTLKGGSYGPILMALRSGAPFSQFAAAVNASPWGTHFRSGGSVRRFQEGGFVDPLSTNFTSDAVTSVDGWSYGTPTKGHKTKHPTGLSEVTVPGTGVKGVLAKHEWVSRSGAMVGTTYQGLPVISQGTYDRQKQAYQIASRSHKGKQVGHFGPAHFKGAVSTFGPPTEAAHATAYGKSDAEAGIAINPGPGQGDWNSARAVALKGKTFLVEIGGHRAYLPVIDKGPSALATSGPDKGHVRTIDITGQGATRMGYTNPKLFPTDAVGTAREWLGPTTGLFSQRGVTTFVPVGKGLGADPFWQAYQYALDPTTGMSPEAVLKAAIQGSTLKPKRSSTSGGSGTGGAGGGRASGDLVSFQGRGGGLGALSHNMMAVARHLIGRRYVAEGSPAGGRPPSLNARDGYDCSSMVSTIINLGGRGFMPPVPSPWTTAPLSSWGRPGKGKYVTVGVLDNEHTMMEFFGHFIESSHAHPFNLGPHWDSGWSEGYDNYRHPPGLRRGGQLPGKGKRFRPNRPSSQWGPGGKGPRTMAEGLRSYRAGGRTERTPSLKPPHGAGFDPRFRNAFRGPSDRSTKEGMLKFTHGVWNNLSAHGYLPAHARYPPVIIDNAHGSGAYTMGFRTVHFPMNVARMALHNLNKPGHDPLRDWAQQGVVHEFAHSMQRYDLHGPYEIEGGAQAWADQRAPHVLKHWHPYGDTNYARYVRWVRQHRGFDWIDHKQFRVHRLGGFVGLQGGGFATQARTPGRTHTPHGHPRPARTIPHPTGARTAVQLPADLTMPTMATVAGTLQGSATSLPAVIAQLPIVAVSLGVADATEAVHHAIHEIQAIRLPKGVRGHGMELLKRSIRHLGSESEAQLKHTAQAVATQIKAIKRSERGMHDQTLRARAVTDIRALQDSLHAVATLGRRASASTAIRQSVQTIRKTPNNAKIRGAMTSLSKALNDVNDVSYRQLQQTAVMIQHEIDKKGTSARQRTRLTQALRLVQAAEGARVGALVRAAVNEQNAIQDAQTALQNLLNRKNISQTSAQGTQMMEAYQAQVVKVLRDSVAKLQLAYKQAVKSKDTKATADIAGKLKTALQSLDQATGDLVQAHVAAIEAAAQATSDAAQHQVNMAQGATSQLASSLQASQGDQTVAGGQALASSYTAQAAAIATQITALQGQQTAATSVGDTTLATQIAEAVQQAQGSYQDAMLSATQAIKAGVEGAAQTLSDNAAAGVGLAQQNLSNMQLQQQIAGTDQTPGGRAATAAYINSNVIPALQNQLQAEQAQLDAARSQNDNQLVLQVQAAIGQTIGSILQEQLDAQNAIKDNTAAIAGALSGELGISFQSETFPDLAGMLNGA